MLLGAIEGGGTKMVCAIGDGEGNIIERISLPTLTPGETMPKIIEFFKGKGIVALGLASFGPIDLNIRSKTYGYITATTKTDWQYYDILGTLKRELNVPCGFDTDVNGAALGEATYGCMKGLKSGVYITVGTGIGTGILSEGNLIHGLIHPEGGHITIRRHPEDTFKGMCSFHDDCLEGMASGPAIEQRVGRKAYDIPQDDKVWSFVSYYVAQAICNYIYILSPEKIVLGGGVMKQSFLIDMIRKDVAKLLNGYLKNEKLENLENYIVPASLNDNQAVLGCFKLAYDAAAAD